MEIEVDQDVCIGSTICVGSFPDVFELAPEGVAVVMGRAADIMSATEMERAVRDCPTGAIRLRAAPHGDEPTGSAT